MRRYLFLFMIMMLLISTVALFAFAKKQATSTTSAPEKQIQRSTTTTTTSAPQKQIQKGTTSTTTSAPVKQVQKGETSSAPQKIIQKGETNEVKTGAVLTDNVKQGVERAYPGYLSDVASGLSGKDKQGNDLTKYPGKHTLKSLKAYPGQGYGVFLRMRQGNYQFYKLDSNGIKMAREIIANTNKSDHIYVVVKGTIGSNGVIRTSWIREVKHGKDKDNGKDKDKDMKKEKENRGKGQGKK
jgi:hypothetical protein